MRAPYGMRQMDATFAAIVRGQPVTFTHYGKPCTGTVIKAGKSVSWVKDDTGRTRWMHNESLSPR